jgi:hypothetical protein
MKNQLWNLKDWKKGKGEEAGLVRR